MPRIARAVAPRLPHHITQRGNRRMDVFFDDDDRGIYLDLLKKYRSKYGLEILAYCLMSNHIHLVAIPMETGSLARALAQTHMRYAQHFNHKYSGSGHLWQGRFFSCILDEAHTLAAARYVEQNPVRAGLVGHTRDYRWSSAPGHLGKVQDDLLSTNWPPDQLLLQWRQLLDETDETQGIVEIRSATRNGRPLGSAAFTEAMERVLGRRLKRKKPGRPRKEPTTKK